MGSSGDLAPLSHLALVLLGRGEALFDDQLLPGAVALQRAAIEPLVIQAKEGLSLCNGTQAMTAIAALAVNDAQRLAQIADIAGAISTEALEESTSPLTKGFIRLGRTMARWPLLRTSGRCCKTARYLRQPHTVGPRMPTP